MPGEIKVFTVPNCGRCRAVKALLASRGLGFTEISVEKNFSALREMIRRSGSREVPVTLVDDQFAVGFDRAVLERLLTGCRPGG